MADFDLGRGLEVLQARTNRARVALLAYLALSVAYLMVALAQQTGSIDINAPGPTTLIAAVIFLMFVVTMIGTMILVGMWIHRAHVNLRAAGLEGLGTSPSWAVGWFFIPIANLFKPFQAMRELWNASHGARDNYDQPADAKLNAWWGTWITGNIIANVGSRFTGQEHAVEGTAVSDIIAFGLLAVAAWFLLQIVTSVNAAQRGNIGIATAFA